MALRDREAPVRACANHRADILIWGRGRWYVQPRNLHLIGTSQELAAEIRLAFSVKRNTFD